MSTFRNLLSPLPTAEVCLARAGSGELLSTWKGEDSSNDSTLPGWPWREERKSSRHPCNLCPLAEHALARSHPPSNCGGRASLSKRSASRVFVERQPDLASHQPFNHCQGAELPEATEAGSELAVSASEERLPEELGSGSGSRGPSPELLTLAPECGMPFPSLPGVRGMHRAECST